MTTSGSLGTETAWTSGRTAARRRALTDAGMDRPVAETLVDLLDEQAAPTMTRAEADTRFAAMLERHDARFAAMLERHETTKVEVDARFAAMLERDDAKRARDRAEVKALFAEFRGEVDSRFAQVDARFAQVDVRFAQVDSRFAELKGELDARFGLVEARFGRVEGQIAGLAGQLGTLKWTFGSLMAFNTLLLGVLTYAVAFQ